ncbi:MAG TPA: hypothetical protein VI111_05035, partial [Thermoleophilaceae bacterium]
AVLLMAIAAALLIGGCRIRHLLTYSRRRAPRYVTDADPGKVLNSVGPPKAPRIGPPDLWLDAAEGDLVPWGWLNETPSRDWLTNSDRVFWRPLQSSREDLIRWVRRLNHY